MVLSPAEIGQVADALQQAEAGRQAMPGLRSFSFWNDAVGWDDAYAVQDEVRLRRERGGNRVRGYKVAITSVRKMKQLGVDAPLCGYLSSTEGLSDGQSLDAGKLISPRIEPEIAFITKKALQGPSLSVAEVLAATDYVVAAFEIIDSRYEKGKFDPMAAVADNVSTARHVLGTVKRAPRELDLSLIATAVAVNGELVAAGASAAVFGHPAASVAKLAAVLSQRGRDITPGSVILTGGLVDAFSVSAGELVHARFAGLGELAVRFE
jgi:2-oxo-3-hexenedioate decarboxylase